MEILKLYTSCPRQQAWRLIVQIWHLKNCIQGVEIDKETNILKPNQTHLNIQTLCVKKYTRISVLNVKQGLSHWFVYSILPVQTLWAGRQQWLFCLGPEAWRWDLCVTLIQLVLVLSIISQSSKNTSADTPCDLYQMCHCVQWQEKDKKPYNIRSI